MRVENLPAISFYEKAGWTVTDRSIHTVEHGISYDERVLIKHPAQLRDGWASRRDGNPPPASESVF